jgi:hypothetical protein
MASRLAEQGIATYIATHGVDRTRAIAHIKATHRLGRRPSASAAADERADDLFSFVERQRERRRDQPCDRLPPGPAARLDRLRVFDLGGKRVSV